MPRVARIVSQGKTRSTVILDSNMQVDLRVVPRQSFGAALQYFTGSKEHNIKLRGIASDQGYKLNEYGLFDPCLSSSSTLLTKISYDNMEEVGSKEYKGIKIEKINENESGKTYIFSTKREDCYVNSTIVLSTLDDTLELVELYKESGPFDWEAIDMFFDDNGNIGLTSLNRRQFDVIEYDSLDFKDPEYADKLLESMNKSKSRQKITEGIIDIVGPDGNLLKQKFMQAGSEVWLNRGIFTNHQFSYTFRPKKRRKNSNKPQRFEYALKALALREKYRVSSVYGELL